MIVPANAAKPVGPYSPGILAGDYLYVSGQGATRNGKLAPSIDGQTRDCLENVKAIVEGAGLTMDQVVYAHLYLADVKNYEAVNKIWPEYFKSLPARFTVAVTRMPTDTPIEITVVAYKGKKEAVMLAGSPSPVPISPGVLTADRFYVAGILGRDSATGVIPPTIDGQIDMVFSRLKNVLAAAKMDGRHMAVANIYRTAAVSNEAIWKRVRKAFPGAGPSVMIIEVPALPFGANVSITGVAARDRKQLTKDGPCTVIGDTGYCVGGAGMGDDVAAQTTSALAPLPLTNVVATNVYIESIDDFAKMNAAYAKAFEGKALPTRTTVQPLAPGVKTKFQFSFTRLVR